MDIVRRMSCEFLRLLARKRSPPRFCVLFGDAVPDAVTDSVADQIALKVAV